VWYHYQYFVADQLFCGNFNSLCQIQGHQRFRQENPSKVIGHMTHYCGAKRIHRATHRVRNVVGLFHSKLQLYWRVHHLGYNGVYPLNVNRRFGGTCRLHLKGRGIFQARNQSSALYMLHVGVLLVLVFEPDDGGDMFLRNVGWLSADYTSLYPTG
jgi:hypothetical protein